jgi:hypothetical protein
MVHDSSAVTYARQYTYASRLILYEVLNLAEWL